jgi:hypothetical protein
MTAYSNQIKSYNKPSQKTIIELIAKDIAQVFREEYRVDKQGRRYRAKHAVRKKQDNKTLSLWADLDDPSTPHQHFQKSFAQRRLQIVGDCFNLKLMLMFTTIAGTHLNQYNLF